MRYAGIDFGTSRTGIALSDTLGLFGHPHTVLKTPASLEELAKQILVTLSPFPLLGIVLGFPLLLSGKEGQSAQQVRELASHLQKLKGDLPVHLWDERLTSAEVEKRMKEVGMSRRKRAASSDTGAATLILQNFLDAKRLA